MLNNDQQINSDRDIRCEQAESIREWADQVNERRNYCNYRAAYFRHLDIDYRRFLVVPGQRVSALGGGLGLKLAAVEPEIEVGLEIPYRDYLERFSQYQHA